MNKFLLSAISFAVFFMFSLTSPVDGGSGIQHAGFSFGVAAAVAGDDERDDDRGDDHDRNDDNDANDNEDRDGHDRGDADRGDHDRGDHDSNAAHDSDATHNDSADASCECPPGVRSCICADGTPGSSSDGGVSTVPGGLRSIFGGS